MRYLIAILLIIAIWFVAGNWVINIKNQAAFALSELLSWPDDQLKLENEALKTELFQLREKTKTIPPDFLKAKVYARYPFNDKSLFSINIGAKEGVRIGMVATVKGSLLVGKVEKVFSEYSLVKTIFNPNWQIPVRIGETGIESLFNGGARPRVTMIIKDRKIERGDNVFVANKKFPYGLKIGEVGKIEQGTAADVFQEASVVLPYKSGDLTELWLIK
jgi:cell shape-determining protein MreC